jgi:hypothetical protein
MREDTKALRFSLRLACEHFKARDGCFAVLPPGQAQAQLISAIQRGGHWDLDLLTAFLQKEKASIPRNVIMAPIHRHGRFWAVLSLRSEHEFEKHSARALLRMAKTI